MTNSHLMREVEFSSLPENINLVESLVENLKVEFDLGDELEANILVTLSEAVNNAIFHGNNSDPEKNIKLSLEKTGNEFTFSVEDQGFGFDLSKVKDPTAPENIDKPTGRGIFLMRNLSDRGDFLDKGKKVAITFFQK